MVFIEFLTRISFFSILTWGFYFITVVCALILTTLSHPLLRKYRKTLLAVGMSSALLGTVSWTSQIFMRSLNPDQSRLTPIDRLTITEWIEPISNPETDLPPDEISWQKSLPYKFKFKLNLSYDFSQALATQGSSLVVMDQSGNLHGFNAYNGLNHWTLPLHINKLLRFVQNQKRLYIMERSHLDQLKVSCVDLQNPSLLWQRVIPGSKEGSIAFDIDAQSVLVSAGTTGIWALMAKSGEILWKRPGLYSKVLAVPSDKHILVFEPQIAGKTGAWHFLDRLNGHTISKKPHVYTEIQEFIPAEREQAIPHSVLGRVNSENMFYMSHRDLSQFWSFHAPQKIQLTQYINQDDYFVLYESGLIERRTLVDNQLKWQKRLSQVDPQFLRISDDHRWFAIPSSPTSETPGVTFFHADSGDYQITAKTTGKIFDLLFFGDWMYLFSEHHLWAFKK